MSKHQPRKSSTSPSPFSLALLIVLTMLLVGGAVYIITIGMTAPAPTQTSALAKATATAEEADDENPNYALTPSRVLPVPTDAPLPPGFETIPPPPPPTVINYTPGPTASLQELAPIEEWKEYVNEQQGFTIKYPPNWYLNAGPTGQTTQIFNYDFKDPVLMTYKGPPLALSKIDIMVNRADGQPIDRFLEGETIRDWVYRTGRVSEEDKVIQEKALTLDGFPAIQQIVDFEYGGLMNAVYLKRPDDVIMIGQQYHEERAVPNQIFDLLIQSIRIQK